MSMFWFAPFVIPTSLATPTDLAVYITGNPAATPADGPTNAAILIRSATVLVLDATDGAYYAVDKTTGLATDPSQLQAMNDATCIQAAAWDAIKYNPLAGGVVTNLVKKSKKLLTASFEMAGADAAAASQAAIASELVPEALKKLQQNNLIGNGPYAL